MIGFSANLGFLWANLPLPDAIMAAGSVGAAAVECHWPYSTPVADMRAALQDTGLTMLALNTPRGEKAGDNGLAAVVGRETEARDAIDQAMDYAAQTGTRMIHVMAGNSDGGPQAEACFRANLAYACDKAARYGLTILIEPLNSRDAPGYHLSRVEPAIQTLHAVGADNLKLMFDCYHVQIMQGDLTQRLRDCLRHIGHIQIAGVPTRSAPDRGEVDYRHILKFLAGTGWKGPPIGAEYRPEDPAHIAQEWSRWHSILSA